MIIGDPRLPANWAELWELRGTGKGRSLTLDLYFFFGGFGPEGCTWGSTFCFFAGGATPLFSLSSFGGRVCWENSVLVALLNGLCFAFHAATALTVPSPQSDNNGQGRSSGQRFTRCWHFSLPFYHYTASQAVSVLFRTYAEAWRNWCGFPSVECWFSAVGTLW